MRTTEALIFRVNVHAGRCYLEDVGRKCCDAFDSTKYCGQAFRTVMTYTHREIRTVTLPDGKEIQVFVSPCVSVIIGNKEMAMAIQTAILEALRDDPRYLFVTLMGDGFEPGWRLAVQWGAEPECRKLPELRLSNDEHSPAHVVWRVKQELKKFDPT